MTGEQIRQDADGPEVGTELGMAWVARWEELLRGASDLAPGVDPGAAASVITPFLWGLFVTYLARGDAAIANRIDTFAALLAPALTRRPR